MNIISIDYGLKYIGFVLFNLKIFKFVYSNIFNNYKYFYNFLKKIIYTFFPKIILIGFPSFFTFNSISYIKLIFFLKKFLIKIINLYNVRIKLIDEYNTSFNFKKKSDYISAYTFIKKYFNSKVVGFEPTIL
ncbi:putative pre-16S rRNA nuclease [Candidatus Nasuia deltocephalinicola]|nr:putative pre-16S rRNA nuclease [Candidatus Nasuia deltocephalinicola]